MNFFKKEKESKNASITIKSAKFTINMDADYGKDEDGNDKKL